MGRKRGDVGDVGPGAEFPGTSGGGTEESEQANDEEGKTFHSSECSEKRTGKATLSLWRDAGPADPVSLKIFQLSFALSDPFL
mgnify:CR=1 FL=1